MLDLSTYAPFYDRHRFHALARAARAALQACGDPDDVAELWVMLGDAAFRLGHFDDARAHYARAFELRGDPPGAELPERWASAFERWRTEPADGTPGDPERADAIRDRMSATGERYAEAYAFVNGSREVSSMAGWLVTTSHESDSLDELRGFTAYVDPDVRCDGAPCAAFHPISPNTRFGGVLMQELDASGYRGRRVAISAWVRADAPSTRARLFVTTAHSYSPDGRGSLESFHAPASDTWTHLELAVDVHPRCNFIVFGLELEAGGKAWINRVTFEVVGPCSTRSHAGPSIPMQPQNMSFAALEPS